jgi:hypothetical protein
LKFDFKYRNEFGAHKKANKANHLDRVHRVNLKSSFYRTLRWHFVASSIPFSLSSLDQTFQPSSNPPTTLFLTLLSIRHINFDVSLCHCLIIIRPASLVVI